MKNNVINAEKVKVAMARVSTAKFFPVNDDATKALVMDFIGELCAQPRQERGTRLSIRKDCPDCQGTGFQDVEIDGVSAVRRCKCVKQERSAKVWTPDEQVDWLGRRFVELRLPWSDGLNQIRAVYCSKFAPPDGIEAISEHYPDGFPPEHPERVPALPPAPAKRLAAAAATEDPEMQQVVTRTTFATRQRAPALSYTRADLEAIRHLYSKEEYEEAVRRLEARGR